MIGIRYSDLSPGLHGKAERSAHGVTVYLLPGLTGNQRKAALRRLRQEASRGCGPALPVPQLMVALGWDRVRTALRNTAAIVRLHPVASLLHAGAAGTLMTLFVLASVSVPIAPEPLPAAFSPSVRGGDRAPAAAALGPEGPGGGRGKTAWALAAPSWARAGGQRLGHPARPGSGSGSRPSFSAGLGVPVEVSLGAQRSP